MSFANILIIKLSAIGDVIHALPVAGALKQQFPQARITWVVEKPAYDLLTNNSKIDEIIIFDKPRFKSVAGLWENAPAFVSDLRSRRFDLALDLQGLFKSAALGFLSGAPQRYVYCNAREGSHLLAKKVCGSNQSGHIVEQYLDVARALGEYVREAEWAIVPTAHEQESVTVIAAQAGLSLGDPYVVLAPGANWSNKRWPTKHFSQLADWLAAQGIKSVLTGGPGDRMLAEQIISGSQSALVNLTGQTSLKQLAHLINCSQALVGGDTGPMHLAAALKIPVVALMGPTDIVRNGPYGQLHNAIAVSHSCHGCWKRACPRSIDCLADISPATVQAKLTTLLSLRGLT